MSGIVAVLSAVSAAIGIGGTVYGLLQRKLKPTITMLRYLEGDPGDPAKGILPRPGLFERQTSVESAVAEHRTILAQHADLLTQLNTSASAHAALLAMLQGDMATVKAAVTPNGGSSLADKVNKLAAAA